MGCIYGIRNEVNHKWYIGKCKRDPEKRRREHFNGIGSQVLKDAIAKYGDDNFSFHILHDGIIPELLDSYEIEAIAKHNSFTNGYNLTIGGEGFSGGPMSEEHKEKISNALRGKPLSKERREKISKANLGKSGSMKGKSHSEETKQKISAAKTGKRHTKEARENMSRSRKGRTTWNKGVPAHNRSPFYTPVHNLFISLPPNMSVSEKRETLRKEFPDVHRKRINQWVRDWSGIKQPTQRPESSDAYNLYLSLPKSMDLSEKRSQLRKQYPEVSRQTIWYWVNKWQSEA